MDAPPRVRATSMYNEATDWPSPRIRAIGDAAVGVTLDGGDLGLGGGGTWSVGGMAARLAPPPAAGREPGAQPRSPGSALQGIWRRGRRVSGGKAGNGNAPGGAGGAAIGGGGGVGGGNGGSSVGVEARGKKVPSDRPRWASAVSRTELSGHLDHVEGARSRSASATDDGGGSGIWGGNGAGGEGGGVGKAGGAGGVDDSAISGGTADVERPLAAPLAVSPSSGADAGAAQEDKVIRRTRSGSVLRIFGGVAKAFSGGSGDGCSGGGGGRRTSPRAAMTLQPPVQPPRSSSWEGRAGASLEEFWASSEWAVDDALHALAEAFLRGYVARLVADHGFTVLDVAPHAPTAELASGGRGSRDSATGWFDKQVAAGGSGSGAAREGERDKREVQAFLRKALPFSDVVALVEVRVRFGAEAVVAADAWPRVRPPGDTRPMLAECRLYSIDAGGPVSSVALGSALFSSAEELADRGGSARGEAAARAGAAAGFRWGGGGGSVGHCGHPEARAAGEPYSGAALAVAAAMAAGAGPLPTCRSFGWTAPGLAAGRARQRAPRQPQLPEQLRAAVAALAFRANVFDFVLRGVQRALMTGAAPSSSAAAAPATTVAAERGARSQLVGNAYDHVLALAEMALLGRTGILSGRSRFSGCRRAPEGTVKGGSLCMLRRHIGLSDVSAAAAASAAAAMTTSAAPTTAAAPTASALTAAAAPTAAAARAGALNAGSHAASVLLQYVARNANRYGLFSLQPRHGQRRLVSGVTVVQRRSVASSGGGNGSGGSGRGAAQVSFLLVPASEGARGGDEEGIGGGGNAYDGSGEGLCCYLIVDHTRRSIGGGGDGVDGGVRRLNRGLPAFDEAADGTCRLLSKLLGAASVDHSHDAAWRRVDDYIRCSGFMAHGSYEPALALPPPMAPLSRRRSFTDDAAAAAAELLSLSHVVPLQDWDPRLADLLGREGLCVDWREWFDTVIASVRPGSVLVYETPGRGRGGGGKEAAGDAECHGGGGGGGGDDGSGGSDGVRRNMLVCPTCAQRGASGSHGEARGGGDTDGGVELSPCTLLLHVALFDGSGGGDAAAAAEPISAAISVVRRQKSSSLSLPQQQGVSGFINSVLYWCLLRLVQEHL
ncbi:unnamed protein product [Phaeothamnion confervicola]